MLCSNPYTEPVLMAVLREVGVVSAQAGRVRDRLFLSVEAEMPVTASELAAQGAQAARLLDYHADDLAVP